jgi:hypothetical protein
MSGEDWRISGCGEQEAGTIWRRERDAVWEMAEIVAESDRGELRPFTSMRSGTEIHSTRSKRWGKTMAFFRSSPEHPSRRFARTCSTTRVKRSSLSRGDRENWLGTVADRPARFDWSGLREDGQTRPRCAADKDRTDACEDLLPNERRHADLRHCENDVIASKSSRQSKHQPQRWHAWRTRFERSQGTCRRRRRQLAACRARRRRHERPECRH